MSIDDIPTIGTTWRREFRELDLRRLPTAPPRPGAAAPPAIAAAVPPEEKRMSKTQAIIDHLKACATGPTAALKPAQIGTALGGEAKGFDTGTVSALLRFATKAARNDKLRSQKRGTANYWWWGDPAPDEQAETPPAAAPSADDAADAILCAIEALPAGAAIPNAELHARRLRALARAPFIEDPILAAWLRELAGLVEGGAA